MTDTTRQEMTDDEIRELLARACDDAPPVFGWHEVLARHDDGERRDASGRRWMVSVAAAVVLVGGLGLVAALQSRSGEGNDQRPAATPPTVAEVPTVDEDPLAGLSEDDWAVPSVLPPGYEIIVARQDDPRMPGSLLVGGDEVAEVTISTYTAPDGRVSDAVEEGVTEPDRTDALERVVDVAGIDWLVQSMVTDDGVVEGHILRREVNDRAVILSARGDLEPLIEIAVALRPVPDAELDVPRLSFESDDYQTVARLDGSEVRAHGVNGVYCLLTEHPDGWGGGSCGGRTEPSTPVVVVGSVGGPGSTLTAGVAESDVARVEFVATNGDRIVVEPVDESGVFENRFWITDDSRVGSATAIERAVITYDDGTTAIAESDSQGGRWTLVSTHP